METDEDGRESKCKRLSHVLGSAESWCRDSATDQELFRYCCVSVCVFMLRDDVKLFYFLLF